MELMRQQIRPRSFNTGTQWFATRNRLDKCCTLYDTISTSIEQADFGKWFLFVKHV